MKQTPTFPHRLLSCSFFLLAFLLFAGKASAQQFTLNFDGLQNFEQVGQFYNGGLGGNGSGPGPDYGVTFSPDNGGRVSTAIVAGQTVLFANNLDFTSEMEPLVMNVEGGFTGQFSFHYATPNGSQTGSVTIYDGPNGTGNVLATAALPGLSGTPLYNASSNSPVVLSFNGTAQSVRWMLRGGAADLDSITFFTTPAPGLVSLSSSAGQLFPAFNPDVTSYTVAPVLTDDVTTTTVTATAASPVSTMQVSIDNGVPLALQSGVPSSALTLNGCPNVITVNVITPGGENRDYTINVTRAGCVQGSQGPQGPVGPQGPQGPQGLQGLPGTTPNIFPSAQVYTLGKDGKLTVSDAHVTANSVILLQYVGGDKDAPTAVEIVDGRFSVKGHPNRKFRYVVFN